MSTSPNIPATPSSYQEGFAYGLKLQASLTRPQELARALALYKSLLGGPTKDARLLGAYEGLTSQR